MQFAKGHTLSQGKRKLGGGRKKLPATIIKEMLEKDAQNLPAYLAKLGEKALEGDKEALIYLVDRHLGRPHQSQDLRVKGMISFLPDDYELMTRPLIEEQKLLDEGKDATE